MKNENYYVIHGWMVNELRLKGNELILYAIIYGFSQDGQSRFSGSLKYLQKGLMISRPTVLKCLKSLVEKNLITKHDKQVDGVHLVDYSVSEESLEVVKKLYRGSKETLPGGGKETLPHNTILDNKKDIYLSENEKSTSSSKTNGQLEKELLPLAESLSEIIHTRKNVKHTAIQIKAWARELRRLNTENGVSRQRMRRALRWYSKHIGEAYCPVVESGASFRSKFIKLEAAIERSRNGNGTRAVIQNGGESTLEIMRRRMNAVAASTVKKMNANCEQALRLNGFLDTSRLVSNLADLYRYISISRVDGADIDQIRSPEGLIGKYVDWLERQDWIDNLSESMFCSDSRVFQNFLRDFENEVNVNPLTGR